MPPINTQCRMFEWEMRGGESIAMPVAVVAPSGPLGKNRKHLVNCNDCRFIFNIINIYALSHCFVAVCVSQKKIRFRFLTVESKEATCFLLFYCWLNIREKKQGGKKKTSNQFRGKRRLCFRCVA